jgi:multicomponent Na+:H+ antiporter subunit F
MVAVVICGLALEAAANRHSTTLPILGVLSLLGFVGSVSIARFTRGSDDVEAEDP